MSVVLVTQLLMLRTRCFFTRYGSNHHRYSSCLST